MSILMIFSTALLVGFSGALMPGPLLTATINETYHKGFWAGPRLVLGHALLELVLIIGLIIGLGDFLTLPMVKVMMAFVGATFLLWMGYGILKDSRRMKISLSTNSNHSTSKLPPELIGVLTSISNPYWMIWWATVGLDYISISFQQGISSLISFYLGHISADLIWYSAISIMIVTGKKFLSDKVYQIILFISGVFLIGLAIYFYYSGITFI